MCVYCEEEKECLVWEKTGEMVCYDCRMDFIDQEETEVMKAYGKLKEYKSDLFPEDPLADFPSIRK